jgi:uncharacterized membrane protein YgcG
VHYCVRVWTSRARRVAELDVEEAFADGRGGVEGFADSGGGGSGGGGGACGRRHW